MSKTLWKSQRSYRWYQHFSIVLIAIFFIGADEKRDPEITPDLHEFTLSGQSTEERAKVVAYLQTRSDSELQSDLDDILRQASFLSMAGYEPCLSEVLCRDNKHWQPYLKEKFDALMVREFNPFDDADFSFSGAMFNLELLTAQRRANEQPDPLHIYIEGPKELSGVGYALPTLEVKIQNVDDQKTSVGFTNGGNYRSGRQSRWRILLQDEDGDAVPVREHIGFIGGGLYTEGMLKHGESWETSLNIRSFIEVPPPGEYKLTVLYHNTQSIAGMLSIEGLIVSRSDPVTFIVKPFTIIHSKEDQETVRELLAELDEEQKLKVIAGTYGAWAHQLISPDSPEGKLLSMGLKAVPTIIESLHKDSITEGKRAWLFAILFSLTSENDPRDGSALGSYEYWESGWQIWGGRDGEAPSGGLSTGSKGSVSGAEIDSDAQDKLIDAWDTWLEQAEVKEVGVD